MKDDSAREKALDKLLAEKLGAQAAGSAGACPEASILAAYVERQLAPLERSKWETHFASCVHCQEQIAALVRLSEEDELAAKPIPMRRPMARYRWAWVAPALLAVTVAGLWYVGELPSGQKQNALNAPFNEPAQNAAPPAAGKQEQIPAAAAKKQPAKSPAVAQTFEKGKEPAAKAASANAPVAPARKAMNKEQPAARQQVLSAEVAKPAQAPRAAGMEAKSGPSPSHRAPTAAPQVQAQAIAVPSQRAEMERQPQAGVAREVVGGASDVALAPAAKSAPSARAEGFPPPHARASVEQGTAATVRRMSVVGSGPGPLPPVHPTSACVRAGVSERVAPATPPPLWCVGPHGFIEVRTPSVSTEPSSGVSEDLLDVTFPTAQAGWIVGRHGTILRSTDAGRTWQRISSPTDEDLVHVHAESADSARVSTSSGAEYSTTDGGKTWRPASQQ